MCDTGSVESMEGTSFKSNTLYCSSGYYEYDEDIDEVSSWFVDLGLLVASNFVLCFSSLEPRRAPPRARPLL